MAYNPLYRGKTSKAPSRAVSTGYENGTLSGILMARPVSADTNGKIALTDASDEDSISRFVGISAELIPSSTNGQVISAGRAEALGAQMGDFTYGDPVYLGKNGILIKTRPDVGIEDFEVGDWVVFLGVVVKNEFDPGEKDIQLMIEVIGQL